MRSAKDVLWRIINKVDLQIRYCYILYAVRKADILLTATSAQTNLGDHAISIASRKFLSESFKKLHVVEIPKEIYIKHALSIKNLVNQNATIVVTGGGFLGDLWMTEEQFVRRILNDFKNNKVIIFPQTIFFTPNSLERNATFECYKNVKDISVNVRDKRSYEILIQDLPNYVVHYIPDMVLSYKYKKKTNRSKIALLCIRKDKENCISKEEFELLQLRLKKKITVKETSTINKYIVPIFLRETYVNKKLEEISEASIVITNRLHMMIFAAITGTPCIAMDNLSKKNSGVYRWIEQLPYIRLLDDINDFNDIFEELINLGQCEYDCSILDQYYLELKNEFRMESKP